MLKGSCLCGAVKYEVRGELGPIVFCHCSICRKVNGSAFSVGAAVEPQDFSIVEGEDSLSFFQSSAGARRFFCRACGSPLFSRREGNPEIIRLRIGSLDSPVPSKPVGHIFVSEKADWFDIGDELPQYAERP
jgi:hypothetical protein